jgi:hypothetical protein
MIRLQPVRGTTAGGGLDWRQRLRRIPFLGVPASERNRSRPKRRRPMRQTPIATSASLQQPDEFVIRRVGIVGLGHMGHRPHRCACLRGFLSGRGSSRDGSVYLCSPETAPASVLTGVITDPRDAGLAYHPIAEPTQLPVDDMMFMAPIDTPEVRATRLDKTPNIATVPAFDPFAADVVAPVLLKTGSDISILL